MGVCCCRVNFHTLPGHHTADEEAEGTTLQDACATLFVTMGIRGGSWWVAGACCLVVVVLLVLLTEV